MKTSTMTPYRYKIKSYLAMLPYQHRVEVRKKIMKKFGITKSTLSIYLNLTDESRDMPAMMLVEFSELLNIPMKNLINE